MKKAKDKKGRTYYVLDESDKDLMYLTDIEKEYVIGRDYLRRARREGLISVFRAGTKQICKRSEVEAVAKKIARGELSKAAMKNRATRAEMEARRETPKGEAEK